MITPGALQPALLRLHPLPSFASSLLPSTTLFAATTGRGPFVFGVSSFTFHLFITARCCISRGCFVRLCGRSPKDGEPLNRQAVWDDYIRTLKRISGHETSSDSAFNESAVDANSRLRAITHASARSFRCHSGNDVMGLLLTSERVHRWRVVCTAPPLTRFLIAACSDMIDWLTFGEPEQVVLREWTEGLEIENEFRLFVCEGKLTAASQYDHYAFYPALHEAHASLQQEIHHVGRSVFLIYVLHLAVSTNLYCSVVHSIYHT